MDRKAFFRNLFGAVAAVTIAPVLDKVSIAAPAKKVPDILTPRHATYDGSVWMSHKEYEFQQKWFAEVERQMWAGTYKPGQSWKGKHLSGISSALQQQ